MNDPERLLIGGGDPLELELLRSAVVDDPPEGAKQRAAAALGLGGAGAAIGGAGAGVAGVTKVVATAGIAKWLAVGAGAVVLGAATMANVHQRRAARIEEPVASPAPVAQTASSLPEPEVAKAPDLPALPAPPDPAPAITALSPSAPVHANATATAPSIAREVALLDDARHALRQGQPTVALDRLDAYASQFPAGALGLEASVVRIEALAANHDDTRALTAADRFLDEHPDAPQSAHVRALAERIRARPSNP